MDRAGWAIIAVGAVLIIAGNFASGAGVVLWIGVGLAALGGALVAYRIVFTGKSDRSAAASPEP